jgi:wobble nucleotide-excising tRNase
MIEKVIAIQNVGKIARFNIRRGEWDGVLEKTNIIYAPNGSGKTTLSVVFQSLRGNDALLRKRTTFPNLQAGDSAQLVKLRVDGKTVQYKDRAWTRHIENLEVFNVHFIENTLFAGSSQHRENQLNLFAFLTGEKGARMRDLLSKLRTERRGLSLKRKAAARNAAKGKITKAARKAIVADTEAMARPIGVEISRLDKELGLYSQQQFDAFTEQVNQYLGRFSREMRLEKISKELDQRTTFYLRFGTNRVTFADSVDGYEFRYTLSEGDKNALAFSVFLAKLSFEPELEKFVVVFDDPLTSLDSARRFLTVRELAKLSQRVGQVIVFTHDAVFAAELEREMRGSLSLELVGSQNESWLTHRDHQGENITGLFRDVRTLMDFQESGSRGPSDLRDVVRCLRPVLEGFIRIKYFDRLSANQWLGDFIQAIRDAPDGDDLEQLRKTKAFDYLCDVNDYSKRWHHALPSAPDTPIDGNELGIIVMNTLRLLKLL